MPAPFGDLYHCMGHTFGTWLPGDPRGFRTRHHREHCEGDYRHPSAPGEFEELLRRSKEAMKREPVVLRERRQRVLTLCAITESLRKRNIDLLVCAIDRIHVHLLAQFKDRNPRHWIGIAKKESSHALKLAGCGIEGGIWAVRCKCLPIEDERHHWNAFDYVRDHALRGAEVWVREDLRARVSGRRA